MNHLTMHSPFRTWKKGDDPDSPYVYVKVGARIPEGEHILLGRKLMSDMEIDEIVKELKSDIDEFSIVAKRELRELHNKMRAK